MTDLTDVYNLTLLFASDDGDLAEAHDLALRLRDELLNSDLIAAEFVPKTGVPPAGAKGGNLVDFAALLLSVAPTSLPSLILLIQQWLLRQQSQTLRIKIGEVEMEVPRNVSQAEIDRIVNAVRRLPQPAKSK